MHAVLRRVRPAARAVSTRFAEFVAGDATLALGVGAARTPASRWPAEARLAFVTETELYAGVVRRRAGATGREAQLDVEAMLRDLSELKIGDPVVHEQHGIGRYLGPDRRWTSAKARPSSCSSNTPTTPSCTCRCRSCT